MNEYKCIIYFKLVKETDYITSGFYYNGIKFNNEIELNKTDSYTLIISTLNINTSNITDILLDYEVTEKLKITNESIKLIINEYLDNEYF
jgi:hypothetical protein